MQVDNDIAHVSLNENSRFDPDLHCRRGTVTSACGICGRSTIGDSVHIHGPELDEDTEISIDIIEGCLGEMRTRQEYSLALVVLMLVLVSTHKEN